MGYRKLVATALGAVALGSGAAEERTVTHGSSRRDYGRPAFTEWAD